MPRIERLSALKMKSIIEYPNRSPKVNRRIGLRENHKIFQSSGFLKKLGAGYITIEVPVHSEGQFGMILAENFYGIIIHSAAKRMSCK